MRLLRVMVAALLVSGCASTSPERTSLDAAVAAAAKAEFTIVTTTREPFPEWSGTDLDGYEWSTANLRERFTVVNFWASWCQPCIDEWPELQASAAGHPSVQFVGIDSLDDRATARRFLKENPSEYRHVEDPEAEVLKRLTTVPNSTLPTTVILDPQHRVVAWKAGPVRKGQLRRALAEVLRLTSPTSS